MVNRIISVFLAMVLIFPMQGFSQVLPYMPEPSRLLNPSIKYDLPTLKGIKFNADNPLKFTFVFNRSDLPLDEKVLRIEAEKIGKYFLAALTIPEDDLWVNLSPYEQDRIMPDGLSMTDLGKDMLGEDYVLKQLAASLTYPDSETGKQYWQSINGVGANDHSPAANNFNKVWIVPDKIHIYESPSMVVIDYARLKVLTETDYLAMQKNSGNGDGSVFPKKNRTVPISDSTIAFKKYILPSIEKEVNEGKSFAHLRQLYSAIILATWFKDKLKNSILNSTYFGKGKIKGADCNDPKIKEKIYNEYVTAFKAGVYNIVKRERVETQHFASLHKITRRQYFSGGAELTGPQVRYATTVIRTDDPANAEKVRGDPSARMQGDEAGGTLVDRFARRRLQRVAEGIAELALNSGLEPDVKNTLLRDEIGKQLGDLSEPDRAFAADEIARAVMAWVHEGYRMGPIVDRLTPLIELYKISSFLKAQQEDAEKRRAAYFRTEARISDPVQRERNLKIIKNVVELLRAGKSQEAGETIQPLLAGSEKAGFLMSAPVAVADIIILAVRLEVLSGDPAIHAQDIMDMVDAYNREGTLGAAYGRMAGQLQRALKMLGEGRTGNKSGLGVIQGGQVSPEALKREWKTMVKFDWFSNRATVRSVSGDRISELKSKERLPEAFIEAVWTAREQSTSEAEKLRDIQQAARDILHLDEESAQVLAQWFIAHGWAGEDNDNTSDSPSAVSGRDAGPVNKFARQRLERGLTDIVKSARIRGNTPAVKDRIGRLLRGVGDQDKASAVEKIAAAITDGLVKGLHTGHSGDELIRITVDGLIPLVEPYLGQGAELMDELASIRPLAEAPKRGPHLAAKGGREALTAYSSREKEVREARALAQAEHRKLVEDTLGEFRWRAVAEDFMSIFSEKTKRKKTISLAEAQDRIAEVIWGIYDELDMTGVGEGSEKWDLAIGFASLEMEEKLGGVLFGSGELTALMRAGALGRGVKAKSDIGKTVPALKEYRRGGKIFYEWESDVFALYNGSNAVHLEGSLVKREFLKSRADKPVVYYMGIGSPENTKGNMSGTVKIGIDVALPLIETDFDTLVGADREDFDFAGFQEGIKTNLERVFDPATGKCVTDNLRFGQLGANRFEAIFDYAGRARRVVVYSNKDLMQEEFVPAEIAGGYNCLIDHGAGFYATDSAAKQLVELLVPGKSVIFAGSFGGELNSPENTAEPTVSNHQGIYKRNLWYYLKQNAAFRMELAGTYDLVGYPNQVWAVVKDGVTPGAPKNTGGLDFAKVKDKNTTVAQGGVKLGGDDALEFLQNPDFAGLVLRVESDSLH